MSLTDQYIIKIHYIYTLYKICIHIIYINYIYIYNIAHIYIKKQEIMTHGKK